MKKLSNEHISEIINLYQSGISPKEIGEKFQIYNNSVTRILRKHGVERNQLEKVSQETCNLIIKDYTNGISSTIIANKLNINDSTVCRILKRNHIKIRPPEINKRTFDINQDYFENIDCEDKAYFLGLLYADGNISKSKYSTRLLLHPKDKDILEKFSLAIYNSIKIESTKPHENNVEYLFVPIYSKKICLDLAKLNCTPNKTFNIKFPEDILQKKLIRHFIRGYFDGDGCISIADTNKPSVSFTSNVEFNNGLIQHFKNININCGINYINKNRNLDSSNFQILGFENIKNFYHYLYDDSNIFMQRKYLLFQEFLELFNNKRLKKINKITDLSKYGSTYIVNYDNKKLTSEVIKNMTNLEKEECIEEVFNFYRSNGFPYPYMTDDEIIRNFSLLKNTNVNLIENCKILRIDNQIGNNIVRHFSPHFFDVKCGIDMRKPSMKEVFDNDDKLKEVIKNRLKFNYQINGNMLRQGISNSKLAFKGSVFNTAIAKFIYKNFTKENSIIYDYSIGFGQRLLAALSLPYHIKYFGVDVSEKCIESNKNIFNFLNEKIPGLNKEVNIIHSGSENYLDNNLIGKVNLAFSSPPYFNLEYYENNKSQAYHNNDYNHFINNYWRSTVNNINQMLSQDGIFILNVKEHMDGFNLGEDMINIIKEFGFSLKDKYYIRLTKNLKFANKTGTHKYEPIFIFERTK